MKYVFVFTIISLISKIISDGTAFICDKTKLNGFKAGDNATICIHMLPRQYRIAFKTKVDAYEVLTVNGAYLFADRDQSVNSTFLFQFANFSTPYASSYLTKGDNTYTPIFNLVIKLDKGNIAGLAWDNDCFTCGFTDGCKVFNNITSRLNASEVYTEQVSIVKYISIIYRHVLKKL